MQIDIRYLTTFTYDAAVSESQNALRAKPTTNQRQRLLRYVITVDPVVPVFSYVDYWGTHVDCFGVVGRHTRLTILADSTVETRDAPQPEGSSPWPRADTSDGHREYLVRSPHVSWDGQIESFARDAVAGATSSEEAALGIHDAVARSHQLRVWRHRDRGHRRRKCSSKPPASARTTPIWPLPPTARLGCRPGT